MAAKPLGLGSRGSVSVVFFSRRGKKGCEIKWHVHHSELLALVNCVTASQHERKTLRSKLGRPNRTWLVGYVLGRR